VGTEITLEVGGLTLDYCKNSRGLDHGMLFQAKDRRHIHSDRGNCDHFRENHEDPGSAEMAFCRPLREVLPRIELLGFTLDQVRREYENCAESWREECQATANEEEESVSDVMTFAEFCAFATAYPLETLGETFISSFDVGSDAQIRGRFGDMTVTRRLPYFSSNDANAYSERSYFAGLIGFLHPYSRLRVLTQNMSNLDSDVVWQYGPLVEAGWASESEFTHGARRKQAFLVATEGSSDTHILTHALSLLRPEISDFFRFIDVSDRHPFPGTGNLLKFAEGLIKIDVQNQIVFVFDNDAEGSDAYRQLLCWRLPPNMRAMMLPPLEQFRAFPARGPEGVTNADINGRAAAIECYLDLNLDGLPPAKVVWTNYKKDLDLYHGALECKESYTKAFLKQTVQTISAGTYCVDKLRVVLDALVAECCAAAIETRNSTDTG
jgi:hypothetical protein